LTIRHLESEWMLVSLVLRPRTRNEEATKKEHTP
jgi:hypothetical protein